MGIEAAETVPTDDSDDWTKRADRVMDSHLAQLMEHFDTVSLTVTKHMNDTVQTYCRTRGDGNWYSRFGSVKEWVVKQEEQMRVEQRPAE